MQMSRANKTEQKKKEELKLFFEGIILLFLFCFLLHLLRFISRYYLTIQSKNSKYIINI